MTTGSKSSNSLFDETVQTRLIISSFGHLEINERQALTDQLLMVCQELLSTASKCSIGGSIKPITEMRLILAFQLLGDLIQYSCSIHLPSSLKQPMISENLSLLAQEMANMISERCTEMHRVPLKMCSLYFRAIVSAP